VTAVAAQAAVINTPGLYDIPAELYHADPVAEGSLSSHGIRDLLPPSSPARYRYNREHPQPPKKEYELGHAAHKLVLGTGPDLVLVDRDRWDTNEVKQLLADIRAAGAVPLKTKDWDAVHAMANEIRAHPLAGRLLDPTLGVAERTLIWQDPATGVWCRALVDWVGATPGGHELIVDYKTAESAHPGTFARSAGAYGYDVQQAHYEDGYHALFGRPVALFLFVVQEKEPPYLVSVVRLAASDVERGRAVCRAGRAVFRDCTESGVWPGYTTDIAHISLPGYVQRTREEAIYGDQY
jgi:hypothetical protein